MTSGQKSLEIRIKLILKELSIRFILMVLALTTVLLGYYTAMAKAPGKKP